LISELYDCDVTFPMEREETFRREEVMQLDEEATCLWAPLGSTNTIEDFYMGARPVYDNVPTYHLHVGEEKEYQPTGGRSSDGQAPFFNVIKGNKGYIFAIGWSAQWLARIRRTEDGVTFRSGIADACFSLLPGERIRTSSVVILPYEGDVLDAQNKWRRFLKEALSPFTESEEPPLCFSTWGGLPSATLLEQVNFIKEAELPFDYFWVDAGWYGDTTVPSNSAFEGEWWFLAGNWRVNRHFHPKGLCDVAEAAHKAGMKFLLWFEVERATEKSPIVKEHPEYFLTGVDPQNPSLVLNLGNEDAWQWLFDTCASLIEEIGIDCFREDYNFSPLPFWRKNDTEGRRGMTEILYVNGLYRFWDALRERFPKLLIDNCASGGRRIDVEMLRRTIPLWRSDYQCTANYRPEASQMHAVGYGAWMPYSGSNGGKFPEDIYRVRSGYSPAYAIDGRIANSAPDAVRATINEYLRVRPYLSEDMYPLTQPTDRTDVYSAVEYFRPSQNDGVLMVFRREHSPYESAVFPLRGVCADARYLFTALDTGEEIELSGKELLERGIKIVMPEKRSSKIIFFHAVSTK
jgi:alpha-galactosidase